LITDKTGTITEKPSVEKVFAIQDNEEDLCNSSLNQYSEHPLAQAVVNLLKQKYRFTRSQKTLSTGKGLLEP
jgi:Cu2+-exporting ATPase